jgi:hypothetical protein
MEVSANTFIVGVPVAIAPDAQKRDTQVRLVPKNSSLYRGGITVTYRRIDLSKLFREVKPSVERFLAARWMGMAEMLPLLNAVTGMNFTLTDIVDTNTVTHGNYAPSHDFTITAKTESLMYTGTATMNWRQGKEELGLDIMMTSTLGGELWPSSFGNDFTAWDDRRAYGTWLFWDRHFTEEALAANPALSPVWTTIWTNDLVSYGGFAKLYADAFVAQNLEINFNAYDVNTNPKGVGPKQLYLRIVALPDPLYPDVNRLGFSFAAMLYPTDANLYNKYGRAIMYFNK